MRRATSPRSLMAMAAILSALVAAPAGPAVGQDGPDSSMCLLTLDEMVDLTGLTFASTAETRGACTYASDPSVDLYALDLRIDLDASLDSVRFEYERGGQDTTVAGFAAWSSDDGVFVDLGGRLLVVQPVFFLSDSATDPVAVQEPIAELAATRVGPAIEAAFGADDLLTSRFPAEVAGQAVFADVMGGEDFLRFVDLGTATIEEVLAGQGMTLADVTVGTAFVGDVTEIIALQAPGLDAALLVPAVSGRLAGPSAVFTPEVRAGRDVHVSPDQRLWLVVADDILWVVNQADEATFDALLEALP